MLFITNRRQIMRSSWIRNLLPDRRGLLARWVLRASNSPGPASGHHDPPLPGTGSPEALGSNFLSNKPLEPDGTGSVEAHARRPVTSRAMIVFMISDVPP